MRLNQFDLARHPWDHQRTSQRVVTRACNVDLIALNLILG